MIIFLGLLIICINLLVYWPSLFHLFRHDEWYFFLSSKDTLPSWRFIIKYTDWQLYLPYDRLIFRPLHHCGLALNRVLFDANYTGPHILAFIKHMIAVFLLWFILRRIKKSPVAFFFALLFSLLVTGIDPVIWPHLDAYIITTIFVLLAIYIFDSTINSKFSFNLGFSIVGMLIFLTMLTTELGLIMPFVFFMAFLFICGKGDKKKGLKKAFLSLFIIPLFLWGVLYSMHLYFAYPNFNMVKQSSFAGFLKVIPNIGRIAMLLLSGNLLPMFVKTIFSDKVYFCMQLYNPIVPLFVLPFIFLLFQLRIINFSDKRIILPLLLLISMIFLVGLTRSYYINALVSDYKLPTHYFYCANALFILIIYLVIDFDRLKLKNYFYLILVFLIILHGMKTYLTLKEIEKQTQPLKAYFDSVNEFVSMHKNEVNFSFKIVDRPPPEKIFKWYHETCIDGLFSRFINNTNPKYLVEYDYNTGKIRYSLYNNQPISYPASQIDPKIKADYINSIGMKFTKILKSRNNFMIGVFEVTQKEWEAVMGFNPSYFRDINRPVENVSYDMALEFISHLNRREGTSDYRLSTKAEYEQAFLRGLFGLDLVLTQNYGSKNIFIRPITSMDNYSWNKNNSKNSTHPAGTLKSFPGGVYDLMGNVWEWTGDVIGYDVSIKPAKEAPRYCVGGSWRDGIIDANSCITNYPPQFYYRNLGFRVVKDAANEK